MKIALLILGLLDFGIGLLFGNIGHFYSLLTFPLIAIIRGYIGINKGSKSYTHATFIIIMGDSIFFLGLILGIIMYSLRFPDNPANDLITPNAMGQALTFSILTGVAYFALYFVFGLLSAYLCRETKAIKRIIDHDRDKSGHKHEV